MIVGIASRAGELSEADMIDKQALAKRQADILSVIAQVAQEENASLNVAWKGPQMRVTMIAQKQASEQ